jgi:hypothetical protein
MKTVTFFLILVAVLVLSACDSSCVATGPVFEAALAHPVK